MSEIIWLQPCPDSVWELLPSGPEAWNNEWSEAWQYLGSIQEEGGAGLLHEFRHRAHPVFADARVYAHILDDGSGPRRAHLIADWRDLELGDPVSEEP